ncbi:MAG: zf-TFIIB domain-containing protein [Methylococcales bacterium]|nr:zf-TFIIB domain-containing protein [Methylococcales bacterium]
MASCRSCSAPLPSNINRCRYCNIRNDVDLHSKNLHSIATKKSNLECPHCEEALQTITLNLKKPFYIERCKSCFGLFFDPGEIDILLESSVSNIFNINLPLITNINKDRYKKNKKVKYIKCPVCQILMNRVNFSHKSGVVIDHCKKHGIWTDNGEITHLMEWKKAGGELLHSQVKEKEEKNQKKQKKRSPRPSLVYDSYHYPQQSNTTETDILIAVSTLIYKLFK